jgi:hypothetical protein
VWNPPRDLTFEKAQYRRRGMVDRVAGWFNERRRLGTRYGKLTVNPVAFWMLALIERDLRLLGFSDRTWVRPKNVETLRCRYLYQVSRLPLQIPRP